MPATARAAGSDEYLFLGIREMARLIRTRQVSSVELVQAHLRRIERVNPLVNAVVSLDREGAIRRARAADAMTAAGEDLSPLHGLPWAAKDTHATAGMRTTSGSRLLCENIPVADDLVVERIRGAGAVLIGKTNVPEFAVGSHTTNPVFGLTRNPYEPSRSAGGSSGGAAAALATGMVAVAEGSDMGGSLRNPASFCNVVGLRPSPGRVPSHTRELPWQTLTVDGPMGRTVDDVSILLSVIAGPDPRDPISIPEGGGRFAAEPVARVAGLRLAWSADLGGRVPVDPEVTAVLARSLATFEDLGARVQEDCLDFSGAEEAFRTLRAWSFAHEFRQVRRESPTGLGPFVTAEIELGLPLTGAQVAAAQAGQAVMFQRAREFFDRYDALLLPACQVLPFDASMPYPAAVAGEVQSGYLDWMRSAFLVSTTGCPALSVPAGFSPAGLPVGLQIVGPYRGERRVLEIARAFERATGFGTRRPGVAA